MSKQDFEQDLATQIAQLDKSVQPERDLWQGIELSLAKEQASASQADSHRESGNRGPVKYWLAAAASFAFVGVLTWNVINQPVSQGAPEHLVSEDLVQALSQQHEQQKQSLLVQFQDQPALTKNWQQQLDELDEAAAAIKAALEQDPNNVALLKMLQNVHQQQIDLIETVHSPKWQQI